MIMNDYILPSEISAGPAKHPDTSPLPESIAWAGFFGKPPPRIRIGGRALRNEMLMVFVYDVSTNKARRKVAAVLEDGAARVQKSVFEARLSRAKAEKMAKLAAAHLKDGDSLRVYAVGESGLARSRVWGGGAPMEPKGGYWIV